MRDNLSFKELESHKLPKGVEGIFLELMMGKTKWLIMGGYNPHKDNISYFLNKVGDELDKMLSSYENILLLGDFNSTVLETNMKEFCNTYDLKNLINETTCYRNPLNPRSIEVMLTNRKNSFQNSTTIEAGLSDFHKMTITVLKTHFKKKEPIVVDYRKYKYFNEQNFRNDLTRQLEILSMEHFDYEDFEQIFMVVLDTHAPRKVVGRGNNAPFMNKTLLKAFIHRSKLKNRFNKTPTTDNKTAYKKQRNLCVSLLRKEKKKYYNNLDMKMFNDNNRFWKTIKPLFSEKHGNSNGNITIIENDKIISGKKEVADKFNNFFIEAVENLGIEHFVSVDYDAVPGRNNVGNITSTNEINSNYVIDEIDNIITKYSAHPSILKIKENVNPENRFQFKDMASQEMKAEIRKLYPKKASVENDIPTKTLKLSCDIVNANLSTIFNNSKNNERFPVPLKLADVTPIHKAKARTILKTIDQST